MPDQPVAQGDPKPGDVIRAAAIDAGDGGDPIAARRVILSAVDELEKRVTIEWHNEQVQEFIDCQDALLARAEAAEALIAKLDAETDAFASRAGMAEAQLAKETNRADEATRHMYGAREQRDALRARAEAAEAEAAELEAKYQRRYSPVFKEALVERDEALARAEAAEVRMVNAERKRRNEFVKRIAAQSELAQARDERDMWRDANKANVEMLVTAEKQVQHRPDLDVTVQEVADKHSRMPFASPHSNYRQRHDAGCYFCALLTALAQAREALRTLCDDVEAVLPLIQGAEAVAHIHGQHEPFTGKSLPTAVAEARRTLEQGDKE